MPSARPISWSLQKRGSLVKSDRAHVESPCRKPREAWMVDQLFQLRKSSLTEKRFGLLRRFCLCLHRRGESFSPLSGLSRRDESSNSSVTILKQTGGDRYNL